MCLVSFSSGRWTRPADDANARFVGPLRVAPVESERRRESRNATNSGLPIPRQAPGSHQFNLRSDLRFNRGRSCQVNTGSVKGGEAWGKHSRELNRWTKMGQDSRARCLQVADDGGQGRSCTLSFAPCHPPEPCARSCHPPARFRSIYVMTSKPRQNWSYAILASS